MASKILVLFPRLAIPRLECQLCAFCRFGTTLLGFLHSCLPTACRSFRLRFSNRRGGLIFLAYSFRLHAHKVNAGPRGAALAAVIRVLQNLVTRINYQTILSRLDEW